MNISDAYNEWSAQYDTNVNKTRDLEKLAAQTLLQNLDYSQVLELGCGTGKNTQWLAEQAQSLMAFDFSEGMMALAKKKITATHVQFVQADLNQTWPAPDHTFDLVTCSLVLEHIDNLTHIFQEAHRVLQPKGSFYLCELHPFKQYGGTKARFERGDKTIELPVFIHHVSDYVQAALRSSFQLSDIREWFDAPDRKDVPRLISFRFQKQ